VETTWQVLGAGIIVAVLGVPSVPPRGPDADFRRPPQQKSKNKGISKKGKTYEKGMNKKISDKKIGSEKFINYFQ